MGLGKVISASTLKASVIVYDLRLPTGAYIELQHPVSAVLAQVTELDRTEKGETARLDILGHVSGRVEIPPDIGAEIRYADNPLIREVLGVQRKSTTGLYMGKLYGHDIRVFVHYPSLINQHVAVIAKTGGGKCLDGSTLVLLDNGLEVPIKDIEKYPDAEVVCLNKNLKIVTAPRTALTSRSAEHILRIKLLSGRILKLTPEHPVLLSNGMWCEARKLNKGDKLTTLDAWDFVVNIEEVDGKFTVYDIGVPTHHNFVADGVIVHNSYTVGVMVEELMKRDIPIVVIDPHGEYTAASFQNDNAKDLSRMEEFGVIPHGYYDRIVEYSPDTETNKMAQPLRFDERNFDVEDILAISTIDSESQKSMLERAMYMCKRYQEQTTFANLIGILERERSQSKYRLISELQRLQTMPMFQDIPTKFHNIVRKRGMTIINLKGCAEDIQCAVAARIAKRIYTEAKHGTIPPCFLIVEEAHNFIPEMTRTIASKPITIIAQEGRKFGVGLCVVSQRTARVSKNVLAQCGSFIIHKLTNTDDLKAVSESLEGFTTQMTEEVQRLPIGVALISTIGLPHPIIVRIRPRESKHGGVSKT